MTSETSGESGRCAARRCSEPATLKVDIRNRRGRGSGLDYCEDHAVEVADRFNKRDGMTALIEPRHIGGPSERGGSS